MATMVLRTAGAVFGGPVGAVAGALVGRAIDLRRGGRDGPRLTDLTVQGSSYGEPLPRIYGTMRVGGQLIWSAGLSEHVARSGGKRTGGRTTTYSYTASFAVALAARPIRSVRRVWADGKLLRGESGWVLPGGGFRLYLGSESQHPDPLIAAAEGEDATPAYRGIAYAVFEDLPLADFANRIPALSFEVEADADGAAIGAVVADLFGAAGSPPPVIRSDKAVAGFGLARATTLRSALETLDALSPLPATDDGSGLQLGRADGAPATPKPDDLGARVNGAAIPALATAHAGAEAAPAELTLAFADPARDHQTGLQRARRGGPGQSETVDLPAGLAAGDAKRLAETLIDARWAARRTRELQLPWRWAATAPGDLVQVDGENWRVRQWTMEGLALTLGLEAEPPATDNVARPSDAGRIPVQNEAPQGPTTLIAFEPPSGAAPATQSPRLWLIAAGAGPAWRRAEVLVSLDGGASYSGAGVAGPGAVIGQISTTLADGPADRWDLAAAVEVELLSDEMALSSRGDARLWAGANLAMVGHELLQFGTAVQTGPRRWRLGRLLRGRRGSQPAAAAIGAPFALIDPATLIAVELPLAAVGNTVRVKAVGPGEGEGAVQPVMVAIDGRSLRPLAPAHLRAAASANGDVSISWIRRSRVGFDWVDNAETPIGEERERYRIWIGEGDRRIIETDGPAFTYARADRVADGFGSSLRIEIRQIGASVGAGDAIVQHVALPPP